MRGFCTWRGNVIRRILESGHVRALQTCIVAGCRGGSIDCSLPSVFGFHGFQLGLALDFGFISGGAVGVDGLFGEVVGTTAGCM